MLDNLPPGIKESEEEDPHGEIVEVINPSPGLWGEPKEGLITLVYKCKGSPYCGYNEHTHQALYGPAIVKWPEDNNGVEELDFNHYVLYAD